jgi:hypothetical protein
VFQSRRPGHLSPLQSITYKYYLVVALHGWFACYRHVIRATHDAADPLGLSQTTELGG